MGTGVIGGMLAATGIAIFLIPMMFYVIEKLSKAKRGDEEDSNRRRDDAADRPYRGQCMHAREDNRMRRFIAATLLGLILGGCMVGPDYRRPAVETPQSWRFAEKEARDLANTAWWEQFDDPVLNELIAVPCGKTRT